jgi:hypothetical protein
LSLENDDDDDDDALVFLSHLLLKTRLSSLEEEPTWVFCHL